MGAGGMHRALKLTCLVACTYNLHSLSLRLHIGSACRL